jgi:hypothetical protein
MVITGINNFSDNNCCFNIYPNPANETVTIDFATYSANNTLAEVYSIDGKLLQCIPIKQQKTELNISTLPIGVYFVKMKTEKGVAVKKFVKE